MADEVSQSFFTAVDELYRNFELIEGKLKAKHETIDDIIAQIEYIEVMARHDLVSDQMKSQVVELVDRKDFIDELKILLPADNFMRFLRLYTYPGDLQELVEAKEKLIHQERTRINALL